MDGIVGMEFDFEVWVTFTCYNLTIPKLTGARSGVVVKALRYKPAGRRFDSRWCYWNFSVT
jgi:hypothetical protein